MKRKNRKIALMMVATATIINANSVTLSITSSQCACFSSEVTNSRNWQTANMQEMMEVIRTKSLKKPFPGKQVEAIVHLPDVMEIRLVVGKRARARAELDRKG